MASYPKWLYHPTKEAVVVQDEAAHKAMGPGWFESPADLPTETPPPLPASNGPSAVKPIKRVK